MTDKINRRNFIKAIGGGAIVATFATDVAGGNSEENSFTTDFSEYVQ